MSYKFAVYKSELFINLNLWLCNYLIISKSYLRENLFIKLDNETHDTVYELAIFFSMIAL